MNTPSAMSCPAPLASSLSTAAAPTSAESYWERRAREHAARGRGLAAVCSYGMPEFYNRYIDLLQRRALAPWLRPAVSPGRSALDVGCGVGRWSLELAANGYDVTGIDISPFMIEQARRLEQSARTPHQRAGRCSFVTGDLAHATLGRRYDLILSVTVVQHILEEPRARSAMAALAAHLAPGGDLVMLEVAPSRCVTRCDTSVFHARSLEWYRERLRDAGLQLTTVRGVDPMPFKTWLLPHYRRLPPLLRRPALAAVTAVSLPLDGLLARWLTPLSWHKVLHARHVPAGTSRS